MLEQQVEATTTAADSFLKNSYQPKLFGSRKKTSGVESKQAQLA